MGNSDVFRRVCFPVFAGHGFHPATGLGPVWPQLTGLNVGFRAQFAYIDGELAGGEILPLMRLRYGGSAHHWGLAIHLGTSRDS
jgi:hypothetical protein